MKSEEKNEKNKGEIKVNVSITKMDVFHELVDLLMYAFTKLPPAEQDELNRRLEYVLEKISD